MTEEGVVATGEEIPTDADQDEEEETLTLDQRQEELKKSRWNVFLWLGIAVLMFTFALFPMPFHVDYDDIQQHSAKKDIGLVWGPSLPGEDLFDAPLHLDVTAASPPPDTGVLIEAYLIKEDNCQQQLGPLFLEAKAGTNHAYQHQTISAPVGGQEYTFKFSVDPGQYCVIVQYVDANGDHIKGVGNSLSVKGKVWPNQIFGGVLGIICLSLSAFAFFGAQKHGAHVKQILENGNESTEDKVLASLTDARVAAGPTGGPPPSAGGPTGPPEAGPSAPPLTVETPVYQAPEEPATVPDTTPTEPPAVTAASTEAIFEPAEGGYFYKKLPDGNYEQTVYVQNSDGSYVPHEG